MKYLYYLLSMIVVFSSVPYAQDLATGSTTGITISPNSTAASFSVSGKLSYQGLLAMSSGATVSDGSYNFKFDIYNLPSGGTLRHTETLNGVAVSKGTFSVVLHPPTTIFAESLYVEITALAGPSISSPITFAPRTELTTSAYSFAPWITNNDTLSVSNKQIKINYNNSTANPLIVMNAYPGQATFGPTKPISLIANSPQIGFNNYYAGWWKYGSSGYAGTIDFDQVVDGGFGFRTAISGTAGNNVSLSTKMVLTNSGLLGLGTITPTSPLTISSRSQEDTAQILLIENSTGFARLMFKNTASFSRYWTIGGQLNREDRYSELTFHYYDDTSGTDVMTLTGQPGDGSVTVPNNAISSPEILDEPGISVSYPNPSFTYLTVGGYTTVDSVDITIPASGYVVVTIGGYINLFHTTATQTMVYLGIDKSRNTVIFGSGYGSVVHEIPASQSTDYWQQSFSSSRVYSETAGTYRYYFNARYASGTNVSTNVAFTSIRATYYPTLYGTSSMNATTMDAGIPSETIDPSGKK
jgi:hypothetical protein